MKEDILEQGYIAGRMGKSVDSNPYASVLERDKWQDGWLVGNSAKTYWDSQQTLGGPFVTGFEICDTRQTNSDDGRVQFWARVHLRLATGGLMSITAETAPLGHGLWIGSRPYLGLGQFYAYTLEEFEMRLRAILDRFCKV